MHNTKRQEEEKNIYDETNWKDGGIRKSLLSETELDQGELLMK